MVPFESMKSFHLCLTGYEGIERENVIRLAELLGAVFSEKFSKSNTHLLCKSASGLKYDKAKQWRIPTISADWLAACYRAVRSNLPAAMYVVDA